MVSRPAKLSDCPALVELSLQQARRLPALRPDADKIKALLVDCISSANNYGWVIEHNGKVQGALMAIVQDNVWAERKCAHVLLWSSTEPGGGILLLRRFRDWVRGRRAIKMAAMSPQVEWDARINSLLPRVGFVRHGGSFIYFQ